MSKVSNRIGGSLARENLKYFKGASRQSAFGNITIASNMKSIETAKLKAQTGQTNIIANNVLKAKLQRVYSDMNSLLTELQSAGAINPANDAVYDAIGTKWGTYVLQAIISAQNIGIDDGAIGATVVTSTYQADLASTGTTKIDAGMANGDAANGIKDATTVLLQVKQDIVAIDNANNGIQNLMSVREQEVQSLQDMNMSSSRTDLMEEREKQQQFTVNDQLDLAAQISSFQNLVRNTDRALQALFA